MLELNAMSCQGSFASLYLDVKVAVTAPNSKSSLCFKGMLAA